MKPLKLGWSKEKIMDYGDWSVLSMDEVDLVVRGLIDEAGGEVTDKKMAALADFLQFAILNPNKKTFPADYGLDAAMETLTRKRWIDTYVINSPMVYKLRRSSEAPSHDAKQYLRTLCGRSLSVLDGMLQKVKDDKDGTYSHKLSLAAQAYAQFDTAKLRKDFLAKSGIKSNEFEHILETYSKLVAGR